MRSTFLTLCSLLVAAGCGGGAEKIPTELLALPEADLSTDHVDFGEVEWGETVTKKVVLRNTGDLPMGVATIELLEEPMVDSFALSWSAEAVSCPESAEARSARVVAVDTGGGDSGDDTGDTGGTAEPPEDIVEIGPGCSVPITVGFSPTSVGEIWGSFMVETKTQADYPEGELPAYYRDPDEFKKVVILQGGAERGAGNVVVISPAMDLGHLYVGESATKAIFVYNVGDGDLMLSAPTLDDSCDSDFSIDTAQFETTSPLAAGDQTLFEVTFAPTDLDPAKCTLWVNSDDTDSPEVEVTLNGNVGSDPENEAPSVSLRGPEVGYRHNSAEPIELELNLFDVNQPANTLNCKVKSRLAEAKIADCVPSDESGHIVVELPIDLLEKGTDTLKVTVSDQAENYAYASTTILWRSDYPDSDDDGDGYGDDDPTADDYDCDDTNRNTYPQAAEVYDGDDNDCDGGIDEGTLGYDDDGDSVSEVGGDCDDRDADTYPHAMEKADLKDNDCDGVVDEGTSLYDDDGDGFSEFDYDCDDDDGAINPAAVELCDGIDNNCNGLKDYQEGCVEVNSKPMIVGGIRMSHTAIGAGGTTTMSVFVYDADGQAISYAWQEDTDLTAAGHTAIDNPTAQTIQWKAPKELSEGSQGEVYSVTVLVADEDGNQAWTFDEIWVYPEAVATTQENVILEDNSGGCGKKEDTSTAALVPVLPAFAFLLNARRRRRTD